MRFDRIRFGDRFAADNFGGVWEKLRNGKARCLFGTEKTYRTEIEVAPDTQCYVIFRDRPPVRQVKETEDAQPRAADPTQAPAETTSVASEVPSATPSSTSVEVTIYDADNGVVLAVFNQPLDATFGRVQAIISSGRFSITPAGKRKARVFHVDEQLYDFDTGKILLSVSPEIIGVKDDVESGGS